VPITLQELENQIEPSRTALILGAGSSVPSGAPTGAQLAQRLWRDVAKVDPASDDLTETSSILERRYGRRAVIDIIVQILGGLEPTGGLLGLPKFGWREVFTTNFDRLIEKAFKRNGQEITVYRSNYDFSSKEFTVGTKLFKIHGCISQDTALGHKAGMTITERDYENYKDYRQALFATLKASLLTGDVLVIGQSLKDRHLQDLLKEVLGAKIEGSPGQIFLLAYDKDDLRAPLLEDRGVRVAFGGIDDLVKALSSDFVEAKAEAAAEATGLLPISLLPVVREVATELKKPTSISSMFNGKPATYSDIRAGATFERTVLARSLEDLASGAGNTVTVIGAAGVGKTTFARQLALKLYENGMQVWEHVADFPFLHQPWTGVERGLSAKGEAATLLIDECTHALRQASALIDHLASLEKPALRVVLTGNSALWAPRVKSPNFYKRGAVVNLSRLEDAEINGLINLVEFNTEVATLVTPQFRKQPRVKKFSALRQKCASDMFVCLKNVFANESLDVILLQESDELSENYQEYYRYVAALEAAGTRVHRQLLIRMLGVPPATVEAILGGLTGIIDEYDVLPREGIYAWSTRHIVIARKIAAYKFSQLEEIVSLFKLIIDNINPAVAIELQTLRNICDYEFGIGRLGDSEIRQNLYRRLIEIAPGERIPRHRLIRELLDQGELDDVEHLIRSAEEAVGPDAPMERYKIRLTLARAATTPRISEADRLALLRKAYESAMTMVSRYKGDKFSYVSLCDVAIQLMLRGDGPYTLDEAIGLMREASSWILDPDMLRRIREYETTRARGAR